MIVPRPGVAAKIEIGLVGAGDIEGMLVQRRRRAASKASMSSWSTRPARSSPPRAATIDGFFLFERVAYGRYSFRLTADSAKAAGVERGDRQDGRDQRGQDGRAAGRDPDAKAPQIALSRAALAQQSRARINQKSSRTTFGGN